MTSKFRFDLIRNLGVPELFIFINILIWALLVGQIWCQYHLIFKLCQTTKILSNPAADLLNRVWSFIPKISFIVFLFLAPGLRDLLREGLLHPWGRPRVLGVPPQRGGVHGEAALGPRGQRGVQQQQDEAEAEQPHQRPVRKVRDCSTYQTEFRVRNG